MGFFDVSTWRKLVGNKVGYPSSPSWQGAFTGSAYRPVRGPYKQFTSSAGPVAYETVFDISGHGEILWLGGFKPATSNNVRVQFKLTVDGTVLATDIGITATNTSTQEGSVIGDQDDTPISKLRFHKSAKFEVRYNSDPGASETLNAAYWYWLT